MHFNTKYIFQGDTKDQILNKINYNFNQILSFAVGPNGLAGLNGPTGFRGPAGAKGFQGSTGARASSWFKQSIEPTASLSQYDLWINTASSQGQVFFYSATGSWNFTGYSIFDSLFFSTYSSILGPAGATDKFVIGLADTVNAESITLVISDQTVGLSNSNPNKSKVVVSTKDQQTTPIFSFGKSGAISNSIPSFYWQNSGASNDLIFKSNGEFEISSFRNLEINSSASRMVFKGKDFNSNSSSFNLRGVGDFDFSSNTTIGPGSNFSVTSTNLVLTPQSFNFAGPIKVSGSNPGGYVFNDFPAVPQIDGGVNLISTPNSINTFAFEDLTGNPIFSGKPFGEYDSGNFAQTVFGSTGGFSGGTGGPYFYHAQKIKRISLPTVRLRAYEYPGTSTVSLIQNIIDISDPSNWDRNVLVVTPTTLSSTFSNVYLRIPSSFLGSLPPVYSPGKANYFRVLLDSLDTDPSAVSFAGLVFTVFDFSIDPNNPTGLTSFINFSGTNCKFVDFHWISISNQFNANPRLFYKTCTGDGNYLNLTNYFAVGALPPPPPPLPSDPGGGGDIGGGDFDGGGGGFGPGCFLPDTGISMMNGFVKKINEIVVGDLLVSYDFEMKSLVPDEVVGIISSEAQKILEVILSDGSYISSTEDHPYWVYEKGWCSYNPQMTFEKYEIACGHLKQGDILLNDKLERVVIDELKSFSREITQTLTLQTKLNHNFFAGGVLVHNKTRPPIEP